MHPYYDVRQRELAHFKEEARQAFAGICAQHGFEERKLQLTGIENWFQVVFATRKIRITVQGINWGMNAQVDVGLNRKEAPSYRIHEFTAVRKPDAPIAGTQDEQLHLAARYLQQHASDVLGGDPQFFEVLAARQAQRKRAAEEAEKKTASDKLAAGYTLASNSFGTEIFRKPRPALRNYHEARQQFPDAVEVSAKGLDLWCLGDGAGKNFKAIVEMCHQEVGDRICEQDALCDIMWEKATMTLESPVAGEVVWHLVEGDPVTADTVLALIRPE